jgi:hypothetical protein
MPDRRVAGRRGSDPKPESLTPPPPENPATPPPPKAEIEPNRRHFLHRKIGGKKAA